MSFNYDHENNAAHSDCDINRANQPLFHGPDGEPFFGWEMTEDGSGFYTQTSEQIVESRRAAA